MNLYFFNINIQIKWSYLHDVKALKTKGEIIIVNKTGLIKIKK
jgi:hypothetical protein